MTNSNFIADISNAVDDLMAEIKNGDSRHYEALVSFVSGVT